MSPSTKNVYTMEALEGEGYYLIRNYKNGNSKRVGSLYKTLRGIENQIYHRNLGHRDTYGTNLVITECKKEGGGK